MFMTYAMVLIINGAICIIYNYNYVCMPLLILIPGLFQLLYRVNTIVYIVYYIYTK